MKSWPKRGNEGSNGVVSYLKFPNCGRFYWQSPHYLSRKLSIPNRWSCDRTPPISRCACSTQQGSFRSSTCSPSDAQTRLSRTAIQILPFSAPLGGRSERRLKQCSDCLCVFMVFLGGRRGRGAKWRPDMPAYDGLFCERLCLVAFLCCKWSVSFRWHDWHSPTWNQLFSICATIRHPLIDSLQFCSERGTPSVLSNCRAPTDTHINFSPYFTLFRWCSSPPK